MATAPNWRPDWRDAAAYRFERLDRPGFAWEWLRRDPGYREAALAASEVGPDSRVGIDVAAARWGLVAFEDPALAVPVARPMWRAETDREVLVADIVYAPSAADTLSLGRFGDLLMAATADGVTHLLLTDGWRRLRIDLVGRYGPGSALLPRWRLAGVQLQPQLRTLARLVSLNRSGTFSNRLWPRDRRARRWILALRAHDALAAGRGHRELADLFGACGPEGRWRVHAPSQRLQAQRLAALARSLAGNAFANRYLSRP